MELKKTYGLNPLAPEFIPKYFYMPSIPPSIPIPGYSPYMYVPPHYYTRPFYPYPPYPYGPHALPYALGQPYVAYPPSRMGPHGMYPYRMPPALMPYYPPYYPAPRHPSMLPRQHPRHPYDPYSLAGFAGPPLATPSAAPYALPASPRLSQGLRGGDLRSPPQQAQKEETTSIQFLKNVHFPEAPESPSSPSPADPWTTHSPRQQR